MITRRQFSKLGLGLAALSSHAGALFGSGRDEGTTTVLPSKEGVHLRRTGVRFYGAYWGAGGEQIDMLSGNLCFSLPLLTASGRGISASVACSYNSQVWERRQSRFRSLRWIDEPKLRMPARAPVTEARTNVTETRTKQAVSV